MQPTEPARFLQILHYNSAVGMVDRNFQIFLWITISLLHFFVSCRKYLSKSSLIFFFPYCLRWVRYHFPMESRYFCHSPLSTYQLILRWIHPQNFLYYLKIPFRHAILKVKFSQTHIYKHLSLDSAWDQFEVFCPWFSFCFQSGK